MRGIAFALVIVIAVCWSCRACYEEPPNLPAELIDTAKHHKQLFDSIISAVNGLKQKQLLIQGMIADLNRERHEVQVANTGIIDATKELISEMMKIKEKLRGSEMDTYRDYMTGDGKHKDLFPELFEDEDDKGGGASDQGTCSQ